MSDAVEVCYQHHSFYMLIVTVLGSLTVVVNVNRFLHLNLFFFMYYVDTLISSFEYILCMQRSGWHTEGLQMKAGWLGFSAAIVSGIGGSLVGR